MFVCSFVRPAFVRLLAALLRVACALCVADSFIHVWSRCRLSVVRRCSTTRCSTFTCSFVDYCLVFYCLPNFAVVVLCKLLFVCLQLRELSDRLISLYCATSSECTRSSRCRRSMFRVQIACSLRLSPPPPPADPCFVARVSVCFFLLLLLLLPRSAYRSQDAEPGKHCLLVVECAVSVPD